MTATVPRAATGLSALFAPRGIAVVGASRKPGKLGALGRAIPAAEVPWMRIREVWLHAVDLDAGATLDDLPDGVVDLLLDDVTAALSTKDGCPALELVASDRERAWRLGEAPPTTTVTAAAADLAGWLTGRVTAGSRPALPRWL